METKVIKKYPVSEEEFNEIVRDKVRPLVDNIAEDITKLCEEIAKLAEEEEILRIGEDMYLDTVLKFIAPVLGARAVDTVLLGEAKEYIKDKFFCEGIPYELPTRTQLYNLSSLYELYINSYDYVVGIEDEKDSEWFGSVVSFDKYFNLDSYDGRTVRIIPIANLNYSSILELIVKYIVPYGLCIDELSEEMKICLADIQTIYKKYPMCLHNKGGKILFDGIELLLEEYVLDNDRTWMKGLHWKLINLLDKIYKSKKVKAGEMLKDNLLNCEKVRADIDPYEERLLTDPNRGHWDLWLDQDDSQFTIEVDEMVARNPVCDINENGVIAIDFGTKSTIVVYQSDIEHSLPMGIGDGNLSKEPTPKRYENPTVVHFVDLDTFLSDYKSEQGRPKTKWNDLTISHTAMEQFDNSKSEEYYEYLHQIKQWAGQREKQFRVQSHTGKSYVLPAFADLEEDAWNPIEIYAYYIGLYINNMRKGHGIFLDYYLSFPVTYEKNIREKIIRSFEKGLKKSLPTAVLENEEVMKKFHVNGDISEPAAYAVCALQEYGFEPSDDEEVFYGIFDFGGGTTDFDFGLWKQSAKRRYDYTIENFGAGGDKYLGGENLLELLAFEVFKANQALMREKGYTFTLAPKCTEFLGSDALLADSQEAEKNMHNLMEKIRPYWEISAEKQTDEKDDKKANDTIKFVVTLFDKNGNDTPNETLYFSKMMLDSIIENRIRDGVNNFFSALLLSYQNDKVKKPATVNILLAGNSCKSSVVKRVFEEEIAKQEREIKERYKIKDVGGKMFEIFPPLGTEEAYQKMESRGLTPARNDFEKPTGKTGVAFGLIQCRAGGSIERITSLAVDDEIPFQYFLGWRSKKKFVVFKDDTKLTKYRGKPDYNVWYKFIEADDSVFDLYYTTLPECVSGELSVDGNAAVKRLRCEIDVVDENAFVYIRAINPHTLEYVVAKDDNVDSTKMGSIVKKEL